MSAERYEDYGAAQSLHRVAPTEPVRLENYCCYDDRAGEYWAGPVSVR